MKFEWDERKRHINLEKHRIDFADAVEAFDHPMWERLDGQREYGEERWQGVGWMKGRLISLVYTERGDVMRIISARKAMEHEKKEYSRRISS